jgi:hypothetical protein
MEGDNRANFNVPKMKEINFFGQERNLSDFFSKFHDNNPNKIYIDYSPGYFTSIDHSVDRMIGFKNDFDFKFILHLRHPVDQMYAHYLHEIKAHISKRQFGDDVRYSFFSVKSLQKYCAFRSKAVEKLISNFGPENILTVNFYEDIPDPRALEKKFSDFLDIKISAFPAQRISPGGWVPYYIYGGKDGAEIVVGNQIKIVPPKSLILVNGHDSLVWEGVETDVANKLIEGSSSWTREVTENQFEELFGVLSADWQRTMDLLGEDSTRYNKKTALKADVAPMSEDILGYLDGTTLSLRSRIESCGYEV